jgi:site-specific recombinase
MMMTNLKFERRTATGGRVECSMWTCIRDTITTAEGHCAIANVACILEMLFNHLHQKGMISHAEIADMIGEYNGEYKPVLEDETP